MKHLRKNLVLKGEATEWKMLDFTEIYPFFSMFSTSEHRPPEYLLRALCQGFFVCWKDQKQHAEV